MAKSRRAPVNLTDLKIKSLKPDQSGEYVQGDAQVPGFGVRVRPHGTATYVVMKRRPGGGATRITLGRVPATYPPAPGEITLAAARERAREAVAAVRQGVDVIAQQHGERARGKRRRERASEVRAATGFAADSFGELATRYIAQECARLARGAEVENIIRRSLLKAWGEQPLAELRRRDLTALLDPLVESGRSQAAHKLREVALRIVNWAIDRGELEINFLASPSRSRGSAGALQRSRRDRVLSESEIRAVWAACATVGTPFGDLVRLLLLVGQRREEVAGMLWRELDLDHRLWEIGAARYKTDIAHLVPLPAIAVELIRRLPKIDDVYVFSTAPGTRFSGFSKSMERLRQLSGVADWRLHDLRRTARTRMSRLKNAAGQRVGPDVAERVLGHVIGGVRGIYDRYAYLDEKREALDLWAARLDEIVSPPPDNIVPLRAGAAA
jgi:integrase